MSVDWRQLVRSVGGVEKIFFSLLVLWAALLLYGLSGTLLNLLFGAMLVAGAWAGIRLVAKGIRHVIWRLRNRIYVTYIFIAFVPIILILILAQLGASFLSQQIGVYLVNSELERQLNAIDGPAKGILRAPAEVRAEAVRRTGFILRERFPGIEILVRDGAAEHRYPEDSTLEIPPAGWSNVHGLVVRNGYFYAWAYERRDDLEAVIVAPVTRTFLLNLVPNLGSIDLVWFPDPYGDPKKPAPRAQPVESVPGEPPAAPRVTVPPPANVLDQRVLWATPVTVSLWDSPGTSANYLLSVRTRVSTILGVFTKQGDQEPQGLLLLLYLFITLFLVVELVSLIIGVSLTRTITTAVQALYDGTQRIKEGDLSHRIPVKGDDQLADLGGSFNTMTENLQRLVVVEKERERLHAELEIAREVQDALHPRTTPKLHGLTMTAACNAARMVSGDYYDYQMIGDSRVAIAVGDVAGKGISAALLMATVQSSFRTQIRACTEAAAAAANGGSKTTVTPVSTSALVTQLNQQLYDYTAAEKYATFYYAVYDDETGLLTYTNAGHLPPLLIRDGEIQQLEINGMVVGAFPFASYGESSVQLLPGDLLVCFTDGVTEPENEYGEMFGEDRLAQVVLKHVQRGEREIIDAVIDSVREWTGSPELQDDQTLLLARRH